MNYKKLASSIKGMHVLWKSDQVFPDYKFKSDHMYRKKESIEQLR